MDDRPSLVRTNPLQVTRRYASIPFLWKQPSIDQFLDRLFAVMYFPSRVRNAQVAWQDVRPVFPRCHKFTFRKVIVTHVDRRSDRRIATCIRGPRWSTRVRIVDPSMSFAAASVRICSTSETVNAMPPIFKSLFMYMPLEKWNDARTPTRRPTVDRSSIIT